MNERLRVSYSLLSLLKVAKERKSRRECGKDSQGEMNSGVELRIQIDQLLGFEVVNFSEFLGF